MFQYINLNNFLALYNVVCDKTYDYYENFSMSFSLKTPRIYQHVSFIDAYATFFNKPTHIIDNIYIGSAYNAANIDQLKQLNIGLVINVTPDISNYFTTDFIYKQYPIDDNGIEKMTPYFLSSYDTIIKQNELYPTQNILVHCYMGASRSVSIVLYYIIKMKKCSIEEAINIIQHKRQIINPSIRFYNDLIEEYSKL